MYNMDNTRDLILNDLNIRQVALHYCPELKFNRNNRCACPIHGGEHDNFQIYERTNSYYCWTCHSAGDPIKFVSELFDIPYADALRKLAIDFGISIDRKPTFSEFRRLKLAKKRARRLINFDRQMEAELKPLKVSLGELHDEFSTLEIAKALYQPERNDDLAGISDIYVYACMKIPELIYLINEAEDKIALIEAEYKTRRLSLEGR